MDLSILLVGNTTLPWILTYSPKFHHPQSHPSKHLSSGFWMTASVFLQGWDFSGFIRNSGFLSRPKTIFWFPVISAFSFRNKAYIQCSKLGWMLKETSGVLNIFLIFLNGPVSSLNLTFISNWRAEPFYLDTVGCKIRFTAHFSI